MRTGRAFDLHTVRFNCENCNEQMELYIRNDGRIVQSLKKFSNLRICLFASEAHK
jgi:hypothetical protein